MFVSIISSAASGSIGKCCYTDGDASVFEIQRVSKSSKSPLLDKYYVQASSSC